VETDFSAKREQAREHAGIVGSSGETCVSADGDLVGGFAIIQIAGDSALSR